MSSKGKVINMFESPEKAIRSRARNLPLYKCYVSNDWAECQIANVIVSRKHINGNLTLGMYLVDLLCLGVKNSNYLFNKPEDEALAFLSYSDDNQFNEIGYDLAHNIVYAGLEFADEYGFKPHKDFNIAQYILEEDNESIPLIEIECGKNGKPCVFTSSTESNAKIIAHLNATIGEGNFYVINAGTDTIEAELDEEYDHFIEKVKEEFPDFKETDEWTIDDFKSFIIGEKDCPKFQHYIVVDALYLENHPEFDYELEETSDFALFNEIEIDDESYIATYTKDEHELAKYLEIKAAIESKANPIQIIEEALTKMPDSILLHYSKLTYLVENDDSETWNYLVELIAKFPDNLIVRSSAIDYALNSNMFLEAEKLINGKYHPQHLFPGRVFSTMEVINFYSCIAQYFAYTNNLLRANVFAELAEINMVINPKMCMDDEYTNAKDLIMEKKLEILLKESELDKKMSS